MLPDVHLSRMKRCPSVECSAYGLSATKDRTDRDERCPSVECLAYGLSATKDRTDWPRRGVMLP